jgi:hypothetical protein
MLGNDIIDLRDPDARPESFRARFDDRVFSAEEQRAIARDANPLARRWAHWGAKEAAYKLAKQLDPTFVFSPRQLGVTYADDHADDHSDRDQAVNRASHFVDSEPAVRRLERRGEVELPCGLPHGLRVLELRSFETDARVHVVAVPRGSDWSGVELGIEALDRGSDDPSIAVRAMAVREISRSLGVAAERLTIGREGRIPTVELDGAPTHLSLSLSHHGGWIAYAMRLRLEWESPSTWRAGWRDSEARSAGAVWTR